MSTLYGFKWVFVVHDCSQMYDLCRIFYYSDFLKRDKNTYINTDDDITNMNNISFIITY